MDDVIRNYKIYECDNDLIYCADVAYQIDMTKSVEYGRDYFQKYINMEDTEIALKINQSRIELVNRHCGGPLLDVGIGSGEFIKKQPDRKVYGYDINLFGVEWLLAHYRFVDPYKEVPEDVEGWTFWDVLEHMTDPGEVLRKVRPGNYVFVAIPIFENVWDVKKSKHYRPNEHYYYFTSKGLVDYMEARGFACLEVNDAEVKAGRESIGSFAFRLQ